MRNAPSNSDDVIDSRDIIARIEELEGERDGFMVPCTDCANLDRGMCRTCHNDRERQSDTGWAREYPEDAAELAALSKLAEEASGYAADWEHGETLIRDTYFTEYTEEMLEDCGYIPKDLPGWIVLDMEATAKNVQQDYTSVDFDGVTYWVR